MHRVEGDGDDWKSIEELDIYIIVIWCGMEIKNKLIVHMCNGCVRDIDVVGWKEASTWVAYIFNRGHRIWSD